MSLPRYWDDGDFAAYSAANPSYSARASRAAFTLGKRLYPHAVAYAAHLASKRRRLTTNSDYVPSDGGFDFSQRSQQTMSSMTENTRYTGTRASKKAFKRAKATVTGPRSASFRPTALKAAMFLPGRGAEVDLIANNYLDPIVHKMGVKSHRLDRASIRSALVEPKGQRMNMDFAFKMILNAENPGIRKPNMATRYHCANIFRHTNHAVPLSSAGEPYGVDNIGWHNTLGPDASYIRLVPTDGGTWNNATSGAMPLGFGNTVLSPYRTPPSGAPMYTRSSLQFLENQGWDLNPLKLTGDVSYYPGTAANPNYQYGQSFANVFPESGNGISASRSAPYMQRGVLTAAGTSSLLGDFSPNKYITQHGHGGVKYLFSNDGTNAVTLECVVVGFKKQRGGAVDATNDQNLDTFVDPYSSLQREVYQAWVTRANARKNTTPQTLGGIGPSTTIGGSQPPSFNPPFDDASCDFVPTNVFPWMGNTNISSTTTFGNYIPCGNQSMFKVVSRDQFCLGGGQSRRWSTSFPSVSYDATRESPQLNVNVNTWSYMVVWSVCSAPMNLINDSTSAGVSDKIVLSRECNNVNVSVTGTYFETPTPVVCQKQPCPLSNKGALQPVTAEVAFPTGSLPQTLGTVPAATAAENLTYVDIPSNSQMNFSTTAQDTLQLGTMSTAA